MTASKTPGTPKTPPAKARTTTRLPDAEKLAPPPVGVGDLCGALLAACMESVTDRDVREMVGACVARAKTGNPTAIKFVVDLIGGAAKAGQLRMTGGPSPLALRRLCALHIDRNGPTLPAALAALCCVSAAELADVTGCDWFDVPAVGSVKLTPTGRREAGL